METIEIPNVVIYLIFFTTTLIFAILINRLFLKFSMTLGIRDLEENVIRWGPKTKPSLGGISFFIIFLLSISFLVVFNIGIQHTAFA